MCVLTSPPRDSRGSLVSEVRGKGDSCDSCLCRRPHLAREEEKDMSRKDKVSRVSVSIQGHRESTLAQGTEEEARQALRLSIDLMPPEGRYDKGVRALCQCQDSDSILRVPPAGCHFLIAVEGRGTGCYFLG